MRSEFEDTRTLINSDSQEDLLHVKLRSGSGIYNGKLFLSCGVALLGALGMGYAIGYSSPADTDLKSNHLLTPDEATWFAALLAIGAIFGGPVAGYLLGKIGRKLTVMLCSVPLVVGWVFLATGQSVPLLYTGRILTGLGTGMVSLVTPVYIAELASPKLRGLLGASFQLLVTIGILLVYALGIVFNHVWLAIVAAAIATVLIGAMSFMPDTPHFHLIKKHRQQALNVLSWVRGPVVDVDVECREIEDALDNSNEKFSMLEFKQKSLLKPLIISVVLMFVQQFSGINAVMFNAKDIMLTAVTGISADAATVILAAAQVGATFVSVILMDVAGRRILLVSAGILMTVSSTTLGLYYQLEANQQNSTSSGVDSLLAGATPSGATPVVNLSWLSLTSLIVYIIGFSIGWGPIPWLIMSEIFPSKARGAASGIATASNWLFAFIVTKTFDQLKNAITTQGAFWLYAGICLLGVVFVLLFVPETKGKSLEEIEADFIGDNQPVRSNAPSDNAVVH